jgi:hypothetical protein
VLEVNNAGGDYGTWRWRRRVELLCSPETKTKTSCSPSYLSTAKGYVGCLGRAGLVLMGGLLGCSVGLHGQVRVQVVFFPFLFFFCFIFCFQFWFL